MAGGLHSSRFEKLSRDNYDTWKIQAEALLIRNHTWGYVSGEIRDPAIEGKDKAHAQAEFAHKAWVNADRKAKADLILSINPSELKQIQDCITSRDVWLKLETIYASKGPARKMLLFKRLTRHVMREDDDLEDHLAGFFDAADKLKRMDIDVNQELLVMMLLESLPESYDNFRCAIESRVALPDLDSLKSKIIEEQIARMKKRNGGNSNTAMFEKRGKEFFKNLKVDASGNNSSCSSLFEGTQWPKMANSKLKCGFCRQMGHEESECRLKKKVMKYRNREIRTVWDSILEIVARLRAGF